jgi:hypothetical protein
MCIALTPTRFYLQFIKSQELYVRPMRRYYNRKIADWRPSLDETGRIKGSASVSSTDIDRAKNWACKMAQLLHKAEPHN